MQRPYIFLCTGMTLDGKICTREKKQAQIATNDDKELLWDSRVRADAIMVGGKTLLQDDPGLILKNENKLQERLELGKNKYPWKVAVISDASDINTNGDFFKRGDSKKIIFTTKKTPKAKIEEIKNQPNTDVYVIDEKRVNLNKAMEILYGLGVKTLMVEGGGELIFSLFENDLVDEINLKIGNRIFGGRNAPTFVDGNGFDELTAKKVRIVGCEKRENYVILKCIPIK